MSRKKAPNTNISKQIASRARGKRIVITLPSRLVRRLEKQFEPAERDRLIAGMLTEHLDKLEAEQAQARKQAERKRAVGSFFQKVGDTFLP